MSKLRDAAQQALEALEWADNAMYEGTPIQVNTQKAITALRAALAELEYKDMSNNTPEALRLARMIEHYNAGVGSQRIFEDYQQAADELRRLSFENEKLRAALAEQPAEQEPLTREEIFELAEPFGEFQYGDAQGHKRIDFARAIERAHGIGEQE